MYYLKDLLNLKVTQILKSANKVRRQIDRSLHISIGIWI